MNNLNIKNEKNIPPEHIVLLEQNGKNLFIGTCRRKKLENLTLNLLMGRRPSTSRSERAARAGTCARQASTHPPALPRVLAGQTRLMQETPDALGWKAAAFHAASWRQHGRGITTSRCLLFFLKKIFHSFLGFSPSSWPSLLKSTPPSPS